MYELGLFEAFEEGQIDVNGKLGPAVCTYTLLNTGRVIPQLAVYGQIWIQSLKCTSVGSVFNYLKYN